MQNNNSEKGKFTLILTIFLKFASKKQFLIEKQIFSEKYLFQLTTKTNLLPDRLFL